MRKTFGTGSVWEQNLGYSRAVQVDNTLYISATAASGEEGVVGGDFYTQTRYIFTSSAPSWPTPASASPTWCSPSCT
jgi:enamine deaminase RidA (YjgF/YER057c/UK114 family)